jgi:hypothetical protein
MNGARFIASKIMNTVSKTQNGAARINRVPEEKLCEWFMNLWKHVTSNKGDTDYARME